MSEPGSYANAPVTISTLRAARTENAKDWTPRDVLIDVLRRLDKGEIAPDAVIVVWSETDEGDAGYVDYSIAADSGITTLGLMTRALYRINIDMEPAW